MTLRAHAGGAARGARVPPPAAVALLALLAALPLGVLASDAPRALAPERLLSLPALAALLALAVAVVALLRSTTTAAAILAASVYLYLSQALVRGYGMPSVLTLLAGPLALAAWLRRDEPARWRALVHPLGGALLAYGLLLLASTTWAHDVALADARVQEYGRMLLVYALAATLAAERGALRAAVWAILLAGAFLSLLALVQTATGDYAQDFGGLARVKQAQVYADVREPRIAGPVGDPNFFAQLLLPLLPLGLFTGWEENRRRMRALALGCAALAVAGTVLTYSRGAALALGVVFVLTLASHRTRLRKLAVLGALAAVAGMALLPANFTRRLTTVAQVVPGGETPLHLDSSIEERRLLARTAWLMFTVHPALGVGAGNYTTHYDTFAGEVGSEARLYDDPGDMRYPHSLALEVAAETGLAGLALLGAALATCFATLHRARRRLAQAGDAWFAGIARALQIGLVGHLVAALFLHGAFQRHLWLLFGLAAALSAIAAGPAAAGAAGAAATPSPSTER